MGIKRIKTSKTGDVALLIKQTDGTEIKVMRSDLGRINTEEKMRTEIDRQHGRKLGTVDIAKTVDSNFIIKVGKQLRR